MLNYDYLYQSRCNSKGVPTFWKPLPMTKTPFVLFGDDDLICDPSWGVESTIKRILALGLHLELPVGKWVTEGRKQLRDELPESAAKLLHSNIRDEATHDQGFRYAADAYGISYTGNLSTEYVEAGVIADAWLSNTDHPLAKAALSEVGIFLVTLGIMRLCGGESLCTLAAKISHDEARHVTTNRSVLRDLGMHPEAPVQSLEKLRRETIDWVFQDLNIPADDLGEDTDINVDYLLGQSDLLVTTGKAEHLNDLVMFSDYNPPFEVTNASMYDRVAEVA